MKPTDQNTLEIKASLAADLFQEGEITRRECFRLEMDKALGEDTGPIKFQKNEDFVKGEM